MLVLITWYVQQERGNEDDEIISVLLGQFYTRLSAACTQGRLAASGAAANETIISASAC
jgi:hypothetical protein